MTDSTTAQPDTAALIDSAAIRAANAVLAKTQADDRDAHQALAAAKAALAAAVTKADQAAATNGDLMAAEAEVQHAELTVRALTRRASATAAAAAEAPTIHRRSIGLAHRHAAFDAIDRRLAAIADAEAAKAALATAEAAFAAATTDLLAYVNAGTPLHGGRDAPRIMQSADAERGFWRGHNVDVERRLFMGEGA